MMTPSAAPLMTVGSNPIVPDAGSALLGLLVYAGAIAVGLLLLYLVIRAGVAAGIARDSRNGHLLHPTHPDRASLPPTESRSIG